MDEKKQESSQGWESLSGHHVWMTDWQGHRFSEAILTKRSAANAVVQQWNLVLLGALDTIGK